MYLTAKYLTKEVATCRYKELFTERYKKDDFELREENRILFLLYAPEDYEVENEMLEMLEAKPDATMDELVEYFDNIAPDGLAPNDDGADLL